MRIKNGKQKNGEASILCGRQGSVKMISLVEISTGLLNTSQAGDRLMYFIQNKCVGFLDLIGYEKNQAIIVRYFG